MKKSLPLARLEAMVANDLEKLQKTAIFQEGDRYHVFGRYEIQQQSQGFLVRKQHRPVADFGSMRSALAWCSADALNKHNLARSICDLEQKKQVESADLLARIDAARRLRDPQRRESAMLKAQQRRDRVQQIENQLDKCIDLAKYWQIQGFENETPRTGRTSSNRTNRKNAGPKAR